MARANLTQVFMIHCDLTGARLDGANLTDAILGIHLTGLTDADHAANLTGADLTNANLTDAVLIGPQPDRRPPGRRPPVRRQPDRRHRARPGGPDGCQLRQKDNLAGWF